MKVELHSHTNRYSMCSRLNPQALISCLLAEEFEAVYITEHDAVWRQDELTALQSEFPEIRIFGGVEITVDNCHLLVLGTTDPEYTEIYDSAEIIRKARAEGCATILAHPLRWEKSADILHCGEMPDALECGTPNHNMHKREQALRLAKQLELAPVFADDVHIGDVVGSHWIETDRPLEKATDVLPILKEGAYTNQSSF